MTVPKRYFHLGRKLELDPFFGENIAQNQMLLRGGDFLQLSGEDSPSPDSL